MITFTVPGIARGKGRPRVARRGAHVALYTDAKTASYEGLVAMAAQAALAGQAPLNGPVIMTMLVRIAPPQSISKSARQAMLSGQFAPTKKPDLDNVTKAILDGCNGVAFQDDKQVVEIYAAKIFAEVAGVDVTLKIASCPPLFTTSNATMRTPA
ncbi:MAG: RusA family crossover junction endodeoxyribonuclease [Alphaproteobacteria bacterium]